MKLIINFIVFSSFSLIMLSCKDSSILMRNEEFNQVWTVESIQSDFENSTFPISILNLKNTEISKISSRTEPKKLGQGQKLGIKLKRDTFGSKKLSNQ